MKKKYTEDGLRILLDDSPTSTRVAIDIERMEKIKIAMAYDPEVGYDPLKNLFEERKSIATAIQKGDTDSILWEHLDYFNCQIKAYLGV